MKRLFDPERVAILGASPAEDNLARFILHNLINFGFEGEILLYGRRSGYLFGHRIITDTNHIPEGIDVACVLVPAPLVPQAVRTFHEKGGVKRFIIYTGGFSEYGEEGKQLEEDLKKYALSHGIKIVGPNCLGIANFHSGFVSPFATLNPALFRKGKVAVIAQSGGVGVSYCTALCEEGIGISTMVSIGNKLILNEVDYLNYLSQDADTEVIVLYLESIASGRIFYEALKACPKPVVIHKSNVTSASSRIAQFHTAALAARDEVVTAAVKQAGKIRVMETTEVVQAVKSMMIPRAKGRRLAILSRSGGEGVILADAAANCGFELPEYPADIVEMVRSRSRARVIRTTNPMDLGDVYDIEFYGEIAEKILKLDAYDALVFSAMFFYQEKAVVEKLLAHLNNIQKTVNKPVAVYIGGERDFLREIKQHSPLPIFNYPEEAVKAVKLSMENRW